MNELLTRAYLAFGTFRDGVVDRSRSVTGREEGQTAAEYLGIIVLVAAIIAAIFLLGIPGKIAGALGSAIDSIVNGNPGGGGGEGGG